MAIIIAAGRRPRRITWAKRNSTSGAAPGAPDPLTAETGQYSFHELSPNVGDGRIWSGGGGCGLKIGRLGDDLEPVGELHTQDKFWQLGVTIETTPAFLRALDQLEDHGERGLVREAAFRSDGAVAHGGERALDRVGRPQVFPMLGREVVECQQRVAILAQAVGSLLVLERVALDEGVERGSAAALVSAIQISCSARLAFGCWLFGNLASTFAVLCTQQRCSRVFGQTSPAPSRTRARRRRSSARGAHVEPAALEIEQQIAPIVRTFAGAVGEADQFLAAFRCRADDHENALLLVFETRLQMDAISPDVDVALGREIALLPSGMIVVPAVLQPADGGRRKSGASLPSRAASASEKSPVEIPLR